MNIRPIISDLFIILSIKEQFYLGVIRKLCQRLFIIIIIIGENEKR